jgi:glycerophosphoryl diester phosphodiesterase
VIRIAHRANALEAIDAAAHAGGVELDVRRRDGVLVLAHDEHEQTGALLDDALARAAALGLLVQLDVKEAGFEVEVAAALHAHGVRAFVSSPSRGVLLAFAAAAPKLPLALTYPVDNHGLTRLPRPVVLAWLAVARLVLPLRLPGLLRAAGASVATLNVHVFSRRAARAARSAGAEVYVWTVNDPGEVGDLAADGAAAIISDDPRIFLGGITTA